MARRKKVVRREKNGVFGKIAWGESYTSLILGIIVVILTSILVVSFVKNRSTRQILEDVRQVSSDKTGPSEEELLATYTVLPNDTLKIISQKFYNSEDYYLDIAKKNNIENPDIIEVESKLKIPKIEKVETKPTPEEQEGQKVQESDSRKITGDSYTVQYGDLIWDIALRAYGDGYRWMEIAEANGLYSPDYIYPGQILKIPR